MRPPLTRRLRLIRRPRRAAVIATLLLAACDGSERGSPTPEPPAPDSAPAAPEPALEASFRRLDFVVPAYRPSRERGVGVVFQRTELSPLREDTLAVHTRPDAGAPVVARLIRSAMATYALEVRTPVSEGGALEYGYEDVGLPLLEPPAASASSGGGWLHVLYALAPDSAQLTGWVREDTTRLARFTWSERLPESPLFFLDPDSISFHDAPEGGRVEVALAPSDGGGRYDYILNALETRGGWMRTEVVSPSDYCFDPTAPRRDTVWIRYLDAEERPRVWYYTRGC